MDPAERQVVVAAKPAASEGSGAVASSLRELVISELPQGLSEQQIVVLRLIYQGRSTSEAATGANVHRGTISRWRREHPPFRAAYAMLQDQLRAAVFDDLRALAEDALLGVRMAVAQGDDPRLNLALLKQLGFFKPPTEPEP